MPLGPACMPPFTATGVTELALSAKTVVFMPFIKEKLGQSCSYFSIFVKISFLKSLSGNFIATSRQVTVHYMYISNRMKYQLKLLKI